MQPVCNLNQKKKDKTDKKWYEKRSLVILLTLHNVRTMIHLLKSLSVLLYLSDSVSVSCFSVSVCLCLSVSVCLSVCLCLSLSFVYNN